MKTEAIESQYGSEQSVENAVRVLQKDGLVCLPCNGTYRLIADMTSIDAVNKLFQSKGRTRKAPSLVFVANKEMLHAVTDQLDPLAQKISEQLWPGPITILVPPHPELPRKIVKELSRVHGKLGVRIPHSPLVREIIEELGHPVLVSSANKQKKQGSQSPAQVRKNFVGRVDLFLDAGDLPPSKPSTVVDVHDGAFTITREGQISQQELEQLLA